MSLQSRADPPGANPLLRIGGILAVVFSAAPAMGQSIQGTITVAGTEDPIAAVEVTLRTPDGEPRGQVVTDTLGIFRIEAPAPGRYALQLRHIGYTTQTTEEFDLGRGELVIMELGLRVQVLALEPIEVVERRRERSPRLARFFERAEVNRRSGQGKILFQEDLRFVSSMHNLYLLEPKRPGCEMSVVVDGLPVFEPRDLDFLAEVDKVAGVEIYRSSMHIPFEFLHLRSCALMLVWTRPQTGPRLSLVRVGAAVAFVAAIFLMAR